MEDLKHLVLQYRLAADSVNRLFRTTPPSILLDVFDAASEEILERVTDTIQVDPETKIGVIDEGSILKMIQAHPEMLPLLIRSSIGFINLRKSWDVMRETIMLQASLLSLLLPDEVFDQSQRGYDDMLAESWKILGYEMTKTDLDPDSMERPN